MTWYDAMWQDVRGYVLPKLERELAPDLYYHGVHHTRDDVVLAAERLAAEVGLDAEASLLLKTAALYHDTGFLRRYIRNEPIAAEFAKETLPRFGFMPYQIAAIEGMIMATQLPQSPRTQLEALMCDADLDALGRSDFWGVNCDLRREVAAHGYKVSMVEWLENQILFLESHTYCTLAAHSTRYAQKQRNLNMLKQMLQRETALQNITGIKPWQKLDATLRTAFSIEVPAAYPTTPATA